MLKYKVAKIDGSGEIQRICMRHSKRENAEYAAQRLTEILAHHGYRYQVVEPHPASPDVAMMLNPNIAQ